MQDLDDLALLREYAANNSETAFEELVSRRVGFVYSSALRQARNPNLAEEITQAVFIILAQKAGRISDKTILTGWLFKTTRFAALAQMRAEMKRSLRTATIEKEFQMQSEIQSAATEKVGQASSLSIREELSPLLDEALATLGETDRQAVLLRFFENKSLAEVGNYLGAGEDTARKRVVRAVEKLRKFFTKRGVSSTTAIIAGAISANSVQAAPVALAKSVTAVAIAKGAAASASTLTLIKGALKIMAWSKAKTTIVVGVSVLLATGTATVIVEKASNPKLSETNLSWADDPKYWETDSRVLGKLPPVFILRPTKFQEAGGNSFWVGPNLKMMYKNQSLKWLIATAYSYASARSIYPADFSDDKVDFLFTLPQRHEDMLKSEIKKRFGLEAHLETRTVDVLLLKVKTPDAAGIKVAAPNEPSDWTGTFRKNVIHNEHLDSVINWVEYDFGKPVLDRTGLTDSYDMEIQWQPVRGQSENEAIQKALLNQLGLELVPSREPIEMLVVQKVK